MPVGKRRLEVEDVDPVGRPAKRVQAAHLSQHDDGSDSDHETALDSSTCPSTAPTPTSTRSRPKNIACQEEGCTKRFSRRARFEIHMRSHRGERPYKCTWEGCNKSYIEDKHLLLHVKATHEKNRDFPCNYPGCTKAFLTRTRLRRHEDTHTGKDDSYRCSSYPPCNERFRQKNTLERHIREAHLNQRPYACKEAGCTESFNSSGALRNHKQRDHGEIKHWCDVCKELDGSIVGFVMLSELLEHARVEHRSCEFCNIKCRTNYDLVKHLEMYHSGQTVGDRKTFACTFEGCPKSFTRQSNLNSHIETCHTGRRFVCGDDHFGQSDGLENWSNAQGCRKTFSTKANLESHIRHLHLKQPRPKRHRSEPKLDVLDDLAGATETAKRDIPCTEAGCRRMFKRHHDRIMHCLQVHTGAEFDDPTEVQRAALNLGQDQLVPEFEALVEPPSQEPASSYAVQESAESYQQGGWPLLANFLHFPAFPYEGVGPIQVPSETLCTPETHQNNPELWDGLLMEEANDQENILEEFVNLDGDIPIDPRVLAG